MKKEMTAIATCILHHTFISCNSNLLLILKKKKQNHHSIKYSISLNFLLVPYLYMFVSITLYVMFMERVRSSINCNKQYRHIYSWIIYTLYDNNLLVLFSTMLLWHQQHCPCLLFKAFLFLLIKKKFIYWLKFPLQIKIRKRLSA